VAYVALTISGNVAAALVAAWNQMERKRQAMINEGDNQKVIWLKIDGGRHGRAAAKAAAGGRRAVAWLAAAYARVTWLGGKQRSGGGNAATGGSKRAWK